MRTRALLVAVLGVGLLAPMATADAGSPDGRGAGAAAPSLTPAPTTRPANERRLQQGGAAARPMPVPPDLRRFWQFQPTPEQVQDMEVFVKEHAPNRFKAYKNLSAAFGNGSERLQRSLVIGYIELQSLEVDDADLYRLKLQQMELQDKIFGLVADARDRGRDADRPRLRSELSPLEVQLVKLRKSEAELRVQRLSSVLEHEKQMVASLGAVSSKDIDDAVEEDLRSGGRLWRGPWGGGGPGMGGGRPVGGPGTPIAPATQPSRRHQ